MDMGIETGLERMSGGELLGHAGDLAVTRNRCEVEIIRVAVQHAYLHSADTLDPDEACRPGREQARRRGGSGTPEVSDFAAAELGARLGMSDVSAWMLMSDGLDLVHRLPGLWARVEAGEVRAYLARLVAKKTRDLSEEQAAYVDGRVTPHADGRLTFSRFQALVEAAVATADPEATAAAEARAAEQQVARRTRPDPSRGEQERGMWGFYIKAPARTVLVFDAALGRIADILRDLGDTDSVDKRRVKALLVLSRPDLASQLLTAYQAWSDRPDDPAGVPPADPEDPDAPRAGVSTSSTDGPKPEIDWATLLPHVVMNVHTYADTDRTGIVRVERCGALTGAWVKDHLSPHAKVTIRPVLDIEGQAPVDAYEIPERHRRAVRLMTPADTFPYSTSLDPDQLDHTEPYRHGPDAVGAGQSRLGNYGPLSTRHHRLKTFGRWTVKQPFPGVFYLVDHTGTRALPGRHAA